MEKKDPYESLHQQLKKQRWPRLYMFKFIVLREKAEIVKSLFGPAKITTKTSKNGKYVSVTGKEIMMDSDKVIERYKEAAKIDGIVSL